MQTDEHQKRAEQEQVLLDHSFRRLKTVPNLGVFRTVYLLSHCFF